MKCLIIIFIISVPFSNLAQEKDQTAQEKDQIEDLKRSKTELKLRIIAIEDSIKAIDIKISEAKSLEFRNRIKDSSLIAYTRKGAKLKRGPSPSDEIIKIFEENTKVIIIDYKDGYFSVCINLYCGFMSEVWIKMTDLTSEFLSLKKNETNHISSPESNSISPNSTNTKSVRYKTSRVYRRGPRGGCYYINSNGNKTYVSKSYCN